MAAGSITRQAGAGLVRQGMSKPGAAISVAVGAGVVFGAGIVSAILPDFGLIAPVVTGGVIARLCYSLNYRRR